MSANPVQAQVATPAPPAPAAAVVRGYLNGQVIDKASGRPLPGTNITVVGTTLRTQTDLDGRYRLPVPVGVYAVRAFRLGNVAQEQVGIRITAGVSTSVSFALGAAVVQLQAQTVTAAPTKANSEDALLAMQRSSSRVSDGISAEAIRRAPGANASDAIVRVTGVSIVDGRFAVVRGLAERYSNTLLNGVDLPSPEPLKKIVPLDLFPSSLLESIIVSKTATPDRPGDFAGGSVEVTTKEFPNDPVADLNLSTGYNSQATLRNIPHLQSRGVDWFGFDQGQRRQMPASLPEAGPTTAANEVFAERLRNVWTPRPTPVIPDFGGSLNLGGRFGGDNAPFGYVVSGTYNRQTEATPNRFQQFVFNEDPGSALEGFTSNEAMALTNLGAIVNVSARIGSSQKVGWKNLYTRSAEERLSNIEGFNRDAEPVERLIYQVRYITRTLLQTQLTGDHLITPLLNSRLEWKATLASASRDEPENRSLVYLKGTTDARFFLQPANTGSVWFRFLDDEVRSGQVDWSVPVTRGLREGSLFKAGVLRRERRRAFDSYFFRVLPDQTQNATLRPILELPPEQAFSPEVLGSAALNLQRLNIFSAPYTSNDNVQAYYGMLDVRILSNVRFIGGMRREEWSLDLALAQQSDTAAANIRRRVSDNLLSGNVTINLTERQNLRLAAYQTVARPDPREIAPDYYIAVAGECGNQGNPNLLPSQITNADLRWERYARAGEIIALSGFYKRFRAPISEQVTFQGGANCTINPFNLASARLFGGEFELRRSLTMFPGALKRLTAGLNLTVIDSRSVAEPFNDSTAGRVFKLQGQSDLLANVNLTYATSDGRTDASLLANYFSDRIARYGIASVDAAGVILAVPNVIERGRVGVDAKIRRRFGKSTFSLSARNLTDAEVIFYQDSRAGRLRTGYLRPGVGVSMGVGYAIR
jgi:hypothetical protein